MRISAARPSRPTAASGCPAAAAEALVPEHEPRVVSECLLPCCASTRAGQQAFVATFLEKGDALAEAAALALGESRLPEAFAAAARLAAAGRAPGPHAHGPPRHRLAPARRGHRLLLAIVRDEPPALARDALQALGSLGGEGLGERAREAAAGRPELTAALAKAFARTR